MTSRRWWLAASSPQRGEEASEGEAMRGSLPDVQSQPSPSSGALRHLLPAGEKRELAAAAFLLKALA
ncbi:hypothetical protein QO002_001502 [Pararhizobium capsulatum DSM 1112]|uniref:Uncharacterized protein n=1 Tax=Pararhizobium capsulatum DSM 1112 TaxID=1121113 RepID=A0ABU0BM90_9HYPH|nr:hypothetical protein [Pararhizobium capsulatum DSM 1112]